MKIKLLLGFLIVAFCLSLKAQNTTIIRAGTGITVSPASGVGIVTISATGGGASGAAAVTNAPNFFTTASFNTFNGPSLFVGASTNTGLSVSATQFRSDFIARLDGSTNYHGGSFFNTANSTMITSDHYLWDQSNRRSYDFSNRTFYDEVFQPAAIMTVANRNLRSPAGAVVLDWGTLALTGAWTLNGNSLGAAAVTNAPNFFTTASVNTFNAPTFMVGASNVFGASTTSNYVKGVIMANTNGINTASHYGNFGSLSANSSLFNFNIGGGSTDTGITVGDFYNLAGAGSRYGHIIYHVPTDTFQIHSVSGSAMLLGAANNDYMTFSSSGNALTIGQNSSSANTINGGTLTTAHNLSWNGGLITMPVAGTGTVSNNTQIFTPSLASSNTVSFAPADLISRISTPTGVTNLFLTSNGGAGQIVTQARGVTMTNTLSGPFTVNTIYTNTSGQMATISAQILFPTALANISGCTFLTISSGVTNRWGTYQTCAGVNGFVTNSVGGLVNPGDLFWVTNRHTGAGTPVAIQDGFSFQIH